MTLAQVTETLRPHIVDGGADMLEKARVAAGLTTDRAARADMWAYFSDLVTGGDETVEPPTSEELALACMSLYSDVQNAAAE